MKGIILAGGKGTRMRPITGAVNKHLLPVYDKPLIYYPLSTLMLSGIRDILIISNPRDLHMFQNLFGNGSKYGLNISYQTQNKPRGIADALVSCKNFVGLEDVCVILGDNIFYGTGLPKIIKSASEEFVGAHIFLQAVANPKEFGIATLDEKNNLTSIEEKPNNDSSNLAITGLYLYKNDIFQKIKNTTKLRNELEISDVNNIYLSERRLSFNNLGRGIAWLDAGSPLSPSRSFKSDKSN